jgi:hypothetical protein
MEGNYLHGHAGNTLLAFAEAFGLPCGPGCAIGGFSRLPFTSRSFFGFTSGFSCCFFQRTV